MEEETLFIAEKLAYRPRVKQLKKSSEGIRSERGPFAFGSALTGSFRSTRTCTAPFTYWTYEFGKCSDHVTLTQFSLKQISWMEANSRNPRNIPPANYKRFTAYNVNFSNEFDLRKNLLKIVLCEKFLHENLYDEKSELRCMRGLDVLRMGISRAVD